MTDLHIQPEETELEKVERQLRGFKNLQSFMLESDEKAELRALLKRRDEIINLINKENE